MTGGPVTFDPTRISAFELYDAQGKKGCVPYVLPIDVYGGHGAPIYLHEDGAREIADLHELLSPLYRRMVAVLRKRARE